MKKETYIEQSNENFDAIVIGSGITGGWAAKELCEKGFKTLMIERGRVVTHRKDYITEGKPPWEYPNRTKVDRELAEEQYKIQKQCYAFNDGTKQFFGNDKDYPYSTSEGTEFSWIRANQLGGKSMLWHRQSYRMSEFDFLANSRDGHGNDWPIRYKDLAPWYEYVERFVGISGSKENLPQLPDSVFQPAFEMTAPEKYFAEKMKQEVPDKPVIISRCAHLTEPQQVQVDLGRMRCMARNECQKGCSFGAYFSTQSATLPAAALTGNLHIAPNSVVESLIYDEATNRVKGVRVIDNDTLKEREYFGKIVFMCASTLGTTQIMLNSRSKRFPNGIANSSGVLGQYLMDHNYNALVTANIDGYEDEYYVGRRPASLYVPNFHYEPSKYHKAFKRGYAFAGSASRSDWQYMANADGFGVSFKNMLHNPGSWGMGLQAQGEMLPNRDNQVSLHATKKDKWGIPQLHIHCQWSDNENAMMNSALEVGSDMMKKAGFTNIKQQLLGQPPGLAIHEVGTARMGRDPKNSIVNGYNQSHDVPNLFVTDGSSFCSSGVGNPSLTFMAITARAVDYAAKEVKAGRLS
ncbi:GMC family oxidoreductase [Alteromonas pelagimontana]|uniref:GMC family oxidoreductase n=1 Tax=Alteromonas pelagimontana TaxID=1858656 RepID=A0A6M4MI42_9ALTE|nr:GMC family oxidoreductase [Alteromonas pelagimontana]QJR82285.1 GMC family oxidoreductase [Alteromonas pelagimontana]